MTQSEIKDLSPKVFNKLIEDEVVIAIDEWVHLRLIKDNESVLCRVYIERYTRLFLDIDFSYLMEFIGLSLIFSKFSEINNSLIEYSDLFSVSLPFHSININLSTNNDGIMVTKYSTKNYQNMSRTIITWNELAGLVGVMINSLVTLSHCKGVI